MDFKEEGVRILTGFSGSEQDLLTGSCENGNEPSGFIKGGESD
jgi:hypothetical protein